jgi:hypothetical protein
MGLNPNPLSVDIICVRSYFRGLLQYSSCKVPEPNNNIMTYENITLSKNLTCSDDFKYFLFSIRDYPYGDWMLQNYNKEWVMYTGSAVNANIPSEPVLFTWKNGTLHDVRTHLTIAFSKIQQTGTSPLIDIVKNITEEVVSPDPLNRKLWTKVTINIFKYNIFFYIHFFFRQSINVKWHY